MVRGDIWIQSVNGDEAPKRLTNRNAPCYKPTWTADGREIVFAGFERLFRVPVAGGKPTVVAGVDSGALEPSIRGDRLVYVQQDDAEQPDIWRIPGPNMQESRDPERIIHTSPRFADYGTSVSPDGQKIAFHSNTSGSFEIYVAQADGTNPVQLTFTRFHTSSFPDWSPDGRRIAFNSSPGGKADIYTVDVEGGGEPTRLTSHSSQDIRPQWSHDGRWIYFSSSRNGTHQIWKMSPEGGDAIQVRQDGALGARESADGKHLYYRKNKDRSIRRVPIEGGEEEKILEGVTVFDIVKDRLYYGKNRSGEEFSIHYLDLNTREKKEMHRHEGPVRLQSFTVAPDQKWIYYAFHDTTKTTDIMMIENFR